MSMIEQTRTSEPKAPSLIAWHVSQKGGQNYWHRIGASWDHRDNQGMTLILDSMPVDGRIVLRAPKSN